MNTKTISYSLNTTIGNNRNIEPIENSIENSEINISSSGTSRITTNPFIYFPDYQEYTSTPERYNLQELYDRLERLEKYFEKIKKVMPWVPDEYGEYK